MTFDTLSNSITQFVRSSNLIDDVAVFDFEPAGGFSSYPAAVVVPSEEQASFADNARNELHFLFTIKLYQERPEAGERNAEVVLRNLVDNLIAVLNADVTLGGVLSGQGFSRPVQVKWAYRNAPQVIERVADITLEVITVQ